jgi:hypothetical protein
VTVERLVNCPRCHTECGWCGDYRHMHGQLNLPGSKRRCTLPLLPEGDDCPVCGGDMRVRQITQYERLASVDTRRMAETPKSGSVRSTGSAVPKADAQSIAHKGSGLNG